MTASHEDAEDNDIGQLPESGESARRRRMTHDKHFFDSQLRYQRSAAEADPTNPLISTTQFSPTSFFVAYDNSTPYIVFPPYFERDIELPTVALVVPPTVASPVAPVDDDPAEPVAEIR